MSISSKKRRRAKKHRNSAQQESGMVTAETAMVIPTLVLVACVLTGMLWLGAAQAKINESSRFLVRSISQGDTVNQARGQLGSSAKGLKITVAEASDVITVRVSRRVSVPVIPRINVTLRGSSTAIRE